MQCLPRESRRHLRARLCRGQPAPASIDRIADQGVPGMGHVRPDLVRAPGLQPALDQRRRAQRLDAPHPGDGMAPAIEEHRLPLAVGAVPAQPRLDPQPRPVSAHASRPHQARIGRVRHAEADRAVEPVDLVRLEQRGEPVMRGVGLRRDDQARGVLVDPVHDPRPRHPAHAGDVRPQQVHQRVDQRAVRRARRRVHHHARGLVENDQVGVLERHGQGDLLRRDLGRLRLRHRDRPGLARRRRRLDRPLRDAAARDGAALDQPGDPAARERLARRNVTGQRLVEARRRV